MSAVSHDAACHLKIPHTRCTAQLHFVLHFQDILNTSTYRTTMKVVQGFRRTQGGTRSVRFSNAGI